MKTGDIVEFKDFVDSDRHYYVNTKLRGITTVTRLFTDKMNISCELKIKSFKKAEDNTLCEHLKGVSVELRLVMRSSFQHRIVHGLNLTSIITQCLLKAIRN